MSFTPPTLYRPGEFRITPWSYQSLGPQLRAARIEAPASQNWPAVGRVVYVPFWVPEPTTFTKMFWANGSAVAGNLDTGIYLPNGTRLVSSGSTAQVTITAVQVVDITDISVDRGTYYMALVSDTSDVTQKVDGVVPAAGIPQSFGLLQQASVTLPLSTNASPATFAKYASAFIPLFGVQCYRTFGP